VEELGEIGGHFRDGSRRPPACWPRRLPALPEVLRDMNKWSNNVIARHVLATLGATAEPGEDSVAAGAVVEQACGERHRDRGLVIENGAGLSRSERISAAASGSCCSRPGAAGRCRS
jgi:D-alanyl-D-alanine carboxypeptidase/D-alanyl-D-alanine-endopeptidase (penicillin-binding protein 4)